MATIQPMAQGYKAVVLSPDEQKILATMLANDVIGSLGHGEIGLLESLNEGAPDDPYWGSSEFTMADASNLAADILEGLGGHDQAVTDIREALVWNTPTDDEEESTHQDEEGKPTYPGHRD